jgi:hypothetical protein
MKLDSSMEENCARKYHRSVVANCTRYEFFRKEKCTRYPCALLAMFLIYHLCDALLELLTRDKRQVPREVEGKPTRPAFPGRRRPGRLRPPEWAAQGSSLSKPLVPDLQEKGDARAIDDSVPASIQLIPPAATSPEAVAGANRWIDDRGIYLV